MIAKKCFRCGNIGHFETDAQYCPFCGAVYSENQYFDQTENAPPLKAADSSGLNGSEIGVPWENRMKHGLWRALFETWKQSCFYPAEFYKKMPTSGGIWNPLAYGLIFAFAGFILQMAYTMIFDQLFDVANWWTPPYGEFDYELRAFSDSFQSISNLASIFLFPFIATAAFFIWAGLVHLVLVVFSWRNKDFEATFRIITYSEGPSAFEVVPFIGSIIAILWQIILVIIGVREVHRLTTIQAAIAVLLPAVSFCLCCCCIIFWLLGLTGLAWQ